MRDGICKYFPTCGFYKKYSTEVDRKDKITLFHQYIRIYCFGILQHDCYRYEHFVTTGKAPPDDLTPTGVKYSPGSH